MFGLVRLIFKPLVLLAIFSTTVHAAPPQYDGGIPVLVFDEDGSGSYTVSDHFTDDGIDLFITYSYSAPTPTGIATLVPGVFFGREVTYFGVPNQNGVFTVDLTATDTDGESTTVTLQFQVDPVEDPPELTNPLPDDSMPEDFTGLVTINLGDHFTEVDGQSMTFRLDSQSDPSAVDLELAGSVLTFNAIADGFGSNSYRVCAIDSLTNETCDDGLFEVVPVDDVPVVLSPLGSLTIDEDEPVIPPYDLTTIFEDVDNVLNYSIDVVPSGLIDASESGEELQLTAIADAFGSGTIEVIATGGAISVSSTLALTVVAQPDPPELVVPLGSLVIQEDQLGIPSINLDDHFADADGEALTYTHTVSTTGVIDVAISGSTLSLNSILNAEGTVSVTVTADNAAGPPVSDTLTIDVQAVDDPPVRIGDPTLVEIEEDQPGPLPEVDLSTLYSDPDTPTLSYTLIDNLPEGEIVANLSGSVLSFATIPNQNGSAQIRIQVSDGTTVLPQLVLVDVEIDAVNDAPTNAVPLTNVSIAEDSSSPNPVNLLNAFDDIDGDTLTYSLVSAVPNDIVNVIVSGGSVEFSTILNQFGTATITVAASDGGPVEVQDSFQVTVTPEDDFPSVIAPIANMVVAEDSTIASIDLAPVFEDVDGHPLTYSLLDSGNPAILEAAIAGNSLTLTPVANQSGSPVTIRIEGRDPTDLTAVFQFTVQVTPVSDPPFIIVPQPVELVEDEAGVQIADATQWFDDFDLPFGDSLTYTLDTITGDPVFVPGSVQVSSGGAVQFFILENESGFADIVVTATDENDPPFQTASSVSVPFRVIVNPVNDPPMLGTPLPLQIRNEDSDPAAEISLAGLFIDDDIGFTGDVLTYYVDDIPGLTNFTVFGDVLRLDQVENANGDAVVNVGVRDETGETEGAPILYTQFDLRIEPTNDAPVVNPVQPPIFQIDEDSPETLVPLLAYFDDIDSADTPQTFTYEIVSGGTSPLFSNIVENGPTNLEGILITPGPDAVGFHTVMVRARDQGGLVSPPAPINIEILPVFVIAEDDVRATNEGVPLNQPSSGIVPPVLEDFEEIDVLLNDTLGDPPNTIISVGADIDIPGVGFFPSATQSAPTSIVNSLGIGELEPNGRVEIVGNKIHYFPKPGFNGEDFFDYTIQDGDGDTSTARVTVTVNNSNSPPEAPVEPKFDIFQGDSLIVLAEGGLADAGFDPDPEDADLTVLYSNFPPGGDVTTFNPQADGSFVLTPVPTFVGEIRFSIQFQDGMGLVSPVVDVVVTVAPTPAPPAQPPAGEVEFAINLSDVPLEDAISTEANVLVVMDDSGSMDWDMMTNQSSGVFRLTNIGRQPGIIGRGTWFYYIYDLPTNVYSNTPAPTQQAVDDLSQAGEDLNGNEFGVWRLRNSQFSTIYYNPEIEYTPWSGLDRNNNDFADAPPTAAPLDPFDVNGQTIDLTALHTYTSRFVPLFRNNFIGRRDVVNTDVYLPYYWTTNAVGRPDWDERGDQIVINDPAASYLGGLSRLDCAENDGDPTNCSFTEELQNFANWFTYYRTREYTAKAALGRALADTSNLRMGYAVLNDSNDREAIASLNSSFRTGHKANLLEHIYATNSGGGTPLRRALDRAGRHFECRAGDSFGSGSSTAPGSPACPILPAPEGQCQNNFTLLFSDGTWNGPNPADAVGNADANGAGANTAYDGGVFGDNVSETLADVAMHYYERDLQPTLPDGVPTNGRDIALAPAGSFLQDDELMHQHMKTYTVGFGVVGNVELADLPNLGVDPDNGELVIDFNQGFAWGNPFSSTAAKTDDMLHAALNGRGEFLQANNPVLLAQAFQSAFEDFSDGSVSVSAVAFGSTRLREGTVEYRGFFNLKFNTGDLEAIELLDAVTGQPPVNPLVWSAATQLEGVDPNNRVIITYDRLARNGIPFRHASLNNDQTTMLSLLEVNYLRGDQTLEEPAGPFRARDSILGDIVNSAPRTVGRPQGVRRNRAPFPTDALYSDFQAAFENRRRVVYVGANDGMLHAFDAGFEDRDPIENGTGNELFAYVPNKIIDSSQRFNNDLDQISSVVYSHKYFVDLTPAVEDVFIRPNGSGIQAWRTMLVGGLRGGGKGYFALDITEPDIIANSEGNAANSVLWEFTDADDTYPVDLNGAPLGGSFGAIVDGAGLPVRDLGFSFSEPRIAMTNVDGASANRKKWAAIFGNGYNSTAGIAKLFVLFVDDGVNGWQNGDFVKVNTGAGTIATNPSDPANQDPMAGIPNGLGQPTAIDTDLNGVVDTVYAGDLQGHLYRFEIGDANPNNWRAVKLFTATADGTTQTRQSITTAPTVTKVPNQEGFIITFGTGSFITEEDGLSTTIQSVYGIWDRFEVTPRTADADSKLTLLTEQEITNVVDETRNGDTLRIMSENPVTYMPGIGAGANYGWYIDLDPVRASTTLQGNVNTDAGGLAPPNPQYPGERAIRRIVQRGSTLVLTSVIPRDANSCFRAPPGALWFVDALTGGNPAGPVIDLDNDGIIDENDFITINGVDYAAGILFDAGNGDGSLVDPSVLLGDGDSDFLVINKSHGEDPDIIRIIKDANSKTGRLSWWEILGE